MSVVLYKRRLAPQKYIRAHESRGVTNFDMFSTCCLYKTAMAMGVYTSTCVRVQVRVWHGYGHSR